MLRKVGVENAKGMPGVLAVYTAADLAAYGPHKCNLDFKQRDGSAMKKPIRKSLELDIEPLPAVARASEAAKPGAPQLYDDVPHTTKLSLRNTRVVVAAMEPRAGSFA